MLLVFLGSSVTYGSATNGRSFVEEVAKRTGFECVKEAVSGTTLAVRDGDGDSSYVARLKRIGAERNVSGLIVQLSTNDATQNVPLGSVSDGEKRDVKTVTGAIEEIIAYAKNVWNCRIAFYTNPYFNHERYKKMIAVLYEVQRKTAIDIIDFYNMRSMVRPDEAGVSRYMSDAIHPNDKGYRRMSDVFIEYLQRIRK